MARGAQRSKAPAMRRAAWLSSDATHLVACTPADDVNLVVEHGGRMVRQLRGQRVGQRRHRDVGEHGGARRLGGERTERRRAEERRRQEDAARGR